jgi:hypothetical protein
MTTCTELSDRMPDVAHGRSRWTEAEEHHLAGCADCRAEWELVMAALRLGETPLAAPGDPALLTVLLLERLGRERELLQRRLRIWTAAGIAAAAAVIIAFWTGLASLAPPGSGAGGVTPRVASVPAPIQPDRPASSGDSGLPGTGPQARPEAPEPADTPALATAPTGRLAELPLPEIDDLPPEALDSMLQVLNDPAARADAYELPGLDDSGDRELEQALTGLEG